MSEKHKAQLVRELRLMMQEQDKTRKADSGYHSSPKKRSSGRKKADPITGMQRRSSEEDEDQFGGFYGTNGLLEPPYPFADLWRIYEECDTLMSCVESKVANCELPHDFEFAGDDKTQKDSSENVSAKAQLRDFFSRVNEKHSLLNLREKVRRDREVTANAFIEVIRNRKGKPELLYYTPSTYMRVTELDKFETPVDVAMPRSGKMITVQVGRRFRRFARLSMASSTVYNVKTDPATGKDIIDTSGNYVRETVSTSSSSGTLTWFKEFGDPRIVDATTGEYVKAKDGSFLREPANYGNKASEIWWFRDNWAGNPYGIPKWVSVLLNIKGRYTAMWVNFDHLEQGATPPFALMPQGGKLTKTSREELERILEEIRDPSYYNRPIVLEMEPDISMNLNTGGKSQTSIEVLKLRDPSAEDFMFSQYLKDTEDSIRKVFRLPPLFIGAANDYTNATSYSSIEVAESQIFDPVRKAFDEKVTTELIQNEFGIYQWKLRTKATKISDRETFYKALRVLAQNSGASLNQVTEAANDLLGYDWSRQDGAIYNEPWPIIRPLLGTPAVGVRDGKPVLMDTPPPVTEEAPVELTQTEPVAPETPPVPPITKGESDEPSVEEDARSLFNILTRIEDRGYQPPEITEEEHYEL